MLQQPQPADPETGSAVFRADLDALWEPAAIAREEGWGRFDLDNLTTVVLMYAFRADGTKDHYFIRLGGQYYNGWPPTVAFVEPVLWSEPGGPSRWWPEINPTPPWLGMHLTHPLSGKPGQLVCFSFTAQYYMTAHQPSEDAVWDPLKHTVCATLTRLQEVLRPPYYKKPTA